MKKNEKILFVDDEPRILEALQRSLRSDFQIVIAQGPAKGLEVLAAQGPFAVVVSDLRMPEMNGIEFLARVRNASPDTIRIMLSGHADVEAAISAVNEDNIFRFLTKPCAETVLARALTAGIAQYWLVLSERELLQKTLMGAVTVLTEILAVVYPAAFRRSARIKRYVELMGRTLKVTDLWQFEAAAMLSQIGCVTLPLVTADKVYCGEELSEEERRLFSRHPAAARAFLRSIPRLGPAAEMIAAQQKPYRQFEEEADGNASYVVVLGAQMLHIAIELDRLVGDGCDFQGALGAMDHRRGEFNPALLQLLHDVGEPPTPRRPVSVLLDELAVSMVADEDIRAANGLLLVSKGDLITFPSLERVRSFASELGVMEPMRVLLPETDADLIASSAQTN